MRYFYLDNLRALLMVLGLVLHTCAAFSPTQYWMVSYLHPLEWVDNVNQFIHLFRMPLFFMISGFFAFIMMEKQSIKLFCSVKVLRIGLPFLSVLITINLPQYVFLDSLLDSSLSQYINANSLISHLWFLVNLLIYFVIYALAHYSLKVLFGFIEKLPAIAVLYLIVLVLPLGYLGVLALNKVGIPIYSHIPIIGSLHQLFAYFDYFLLGSFIGRLKHHTFIETMLSGKGATLLTVLLAISSIPLWLPSMLNDVTSPYILHIQAIFVSFLIWLLAMRVMNKNSGPFKYLADASYSIYLFHQVIIIMLVLLINYLVLSTNLLINTHLVFIFIITTPLVITMLIHKLIVRKVSFLSLLFNGKSLPG